MTRIEEKMTEIEKKQSFWRGFISGAAWLLGAEFSLCAAGYYFLQIVKEFQ